MPRPPCAQAEIDRRAAKLIDLAKKRLLPDAEQGMSSAATFDICEARPLSATACLAPKNLGNAERNRPAPPAGYHRGNGRGGPAEQQPHH